jgi:hypothetical protein
VLRRVLRCVAAHRAPGITCPHGGLAPQSLSGAAKRFAVSADTWESLKQLWPKQVLRELAARRDKAARAAAKRVAAGDVLVAGAAAGGATREAGERACKEAWLWVWVGVGVGVHGVQCKV